METKKSIPVSLDKPLIEKIESLAKNEGRSRSGQINFMLHWFNKNFKNN